MTEYQELVVPVELLGSCGSQACYQVIEHQDWWFPLNFSEVEEAYNALMELKDPTPGL